MQELSGKVAERLKFALNFINKNRMLNAFDVALFAGSNYGLRASSKKAADRCTTPTPRSPSTVGSRLAFSSACAPRVVAWGLHFGVFFTITLADFAKR